MPRPEKVAAVADIKERISAAQAVFLAEYAGLSVKAQQVLRRELRANGAEFKIVKMTLARRAVDELDLDELEPLLIGPTGLAYADGDPVAAARVLRDFSRDHEVFTVKGGLLGSDYLTVERISQLAEIEPLDVLLAKLAGAMAAPMAKAAGLFAALPRNAASAFKQLLDKREGEAPEEPTPAAPEEPVDEAPAEKLEQAEATAADGGEAQPAAAESESSDGGDDGSPDAVSEVETVAESEQSEDSDAAEAAAEEE